MVFIAIAVVALVAGIVAYCAVLRRRVPRLTDEELLSIAGVAELVASRPDLSLQVCKALPDQDRKTLKASFLPGRDFRWTVLGGDGQIHGEEDPLEESSTLSQLHRDLTDYMVECTLRFGEKYGHVVVCRDSSTQEYLGSVYIVPPFPSFRLFKTAFGRAVMPIGKPPPYKVGGSTKARFQAFIEATESAHKELMQDQPHWYVTNLGVSNAAQGKGIGRFLMETAKCVSGPKPLYLECHDGNVDFYKKVNMDQKQRYFATPKMDDKTKEDAAPLPYNAMLYQPK